MCDLLHHQSLSYSNPSPRVYRYPIGFSRYVQEQCARGDGPNLSSLDTILYFGSHGAEGLFRKELFFYKIILDEVFSVEVYLQEVLSRGICLIERDPAAGCPAAGHPTEGWVQCGGQALPGSHRAIRARPSSRAFYLRSLRDVSYQSPGKPRPPSSPDFNPPHSRTTAGALATQTYKTNLLQPREV